MNAIELVRKGFYVLPLWKNGKNPITKHGVNDAENTEEYARSISPDSNLGIACRNIIVIDVDVKNGDGLAELAEMEKELGKLDPKGKVITQSGGWHLYFRKPDLDIIGQTHLAFHGKKTQIDLRVGDQYVVAPPSVYNGGVYRWEIEPESVDSLTELPQAWLDFLPKKNVAKPVEATIVHYDIPIRERQERCWRYLSKDERPAIQGQSGQNQMFKIMNVIFNGFTLSKPDGYPVLMQYNAICQPPWDMGDPNDARWIDRTIDEVLASPQMERGCLLTALLTDDERLPQLAPDFIIRLFTPHETHFTELLAKPKVDRWSKDYIPKKQTITDDNLITDRLLDVPGFINDYLELARSSFSVYNKCACFAGALAFLSLLAGPRFYFEQTYANLYVMSLARSSDGKNAARSINSHILDMIGKSSHVGANFTSGEALEDVVVQHGRFLFQVDECDFLFANMAQGKESYQRSIQQNLLQMYSNSSGVWHVRKRAFGYKSGFSENESQVYNPYLVILGTAPPRIYYESLSSRVAEGGLFARLVIFKAIERELIIKNNEDFKSNPICQTLIDFAKLLFSLRVDSNEVPGFVGRTAPVPAIEIKVTPDARKEFEWFQERAFALKNEVGDDDAQYSLLGRACENAKKYAILYELSRKMPLLLNCKDESGEPDPDRIRETLLIDEETANWATDFSSKLVDVQTVDFKRYFYENEHTKLNKDIHNFIRRESRGKTKAALKNRLYQKFDKYGDAEIKNSLQCLINQGRIEALQNYGADGSVAWRVIEEIGD